MKDPVGFAVAALLLVYWSRIAYFYWFQGSDYKEKVTNPRKSVINNILYTIYRPWIRYLSDNPGVGVWGGRIASIFGFIILIGMLIVSITGPFTLNK